VGRREEKGHKIEQTGPHMRCRVSWVSREHCRRLLTPMASHTERDRRREGRERQNTHTHTHTHINSTSVPASQRAAMTWRTLLKLPPQGGRGAQPPPQRCATPTCAPSVPARGRCASGNGRQPATPPRSGTRMPNRVPAVLCALPPSRVPAQKPPGIPPTQKLFTRWSRYASCP
jgi:hypothetical protein